MTDSSGLEVAIVGMACRFPGAGSLGAYWDNLRAGVESITFFNDAQLLFAGVAPELLLRPDYVKARGVLPAAEMFDAAFFDIPPNEAAAMDPQHRVFLELAWTAFEHSGHMPSLFDGQIGIFAGAHDNGYAAHLDPRSPMVRSLGPFATKIGNEKDYLTTRASYKFGLGGPSISVQTACSTSLVAVHLACQALLAGECDMALAGGVTVHSVQQSGYLYEADGIFSPDGHCRPFDAMARGAVSSSGGGVIVLRRLADAHVTDDTVHAVILGSAVNNDGARRAGYTAPGVWGQARVIRAAQLAAGTAPETISYVEGHGSGTALGDPIEVAALTHAFREGTGKNGFCLLGSVKGNIGHTHAASGIAGLIKTALALGHKQIPASLHFNTANSQIDFGSSPFRVVDQLTEWSKSNLLRAGVSSFGLGGTNAHVVVEEAPEPVKRAKENGWEVITLSARAPQALVVQEGELAEFLGSHSEVEASIADVATTLQTGRRAFEHRSALVASGAADAATVLHGETPGRLLRSGTAKHGIPRVAFLLPGVGDQRVGIGRELYEHHAEFREAFDECGSVLGPLLDVSLPTLMFGSEEQRVTVDLRGLLGRGPSLPNDDDPLIRTLYAQPVTFSFEYALARLWMSWEVRPSAMLGYSIGELTAACLAGVFSLPDALTLITERARLIERAPAGAMLAVALPPREIHGWLRGDVWLAVEESPALCVVAGTNEAIDSLGDRLTEQQVSVRRLRTKHAFHCPLVADAADEFGDLVSTIERRAPKVPFLSNVTGDWITDDDAVDSRYWRRHVCEPVRFAQGLAQLWRTPGRILLEVGPGQALNSVALQALPIADSAGKLAVASMPGAFDTKSEVSAMLTAASKLWLAGADINWRATRAGRSGRRIPLPTYPFQRHRHWVDAADSGAGPEPDLPRRSDVSTWFTTPRWVSSPLPPAIELRSRQRWLIVGDRLNIGRHLAHRLEGIDQDVLFVDLNGVDFMELAAELSASDRLPDIVVHLGSLGRPVDLGNLERTEDQVEAGFNSLLRLAQGLAQHSADHPIHFAIVTSGVFQVTGGEIVSPGNATVLGPCRVLPLEHSRWTTRCVDVWADGEETTIVDLLIRELAYRSGQQVVAYRGSRRWEQELRPVRIDAPKGRIERLRARGVYVIIGGFGGIGLTLARFLADEVDAQLVLVGRTQLPARSEWDNWLAAHAGEDVTSQRIDAVRELESRGAEVLPVHGDVTNLDEMRSVLASGEQRFGAINGVIHAAGVLAGGLAQLKDSGSAAAAMAAKTRGTVVLDTLLQDRVLDFFVLCSSTVGVFGGLGQVDYCAANAFLDAYAQRLSAPDGRMTLSVDWDGWQQVGMVATAAARSIDLADRRWPVERVTSHPLLDTKQIEALGRAVYATDLSPDRHWVLDEHRMHGHPVVASTVYIEMVLGAVRDLGHDLPVEIQEMIFLAPCVIPPGTVRQLHLVLEPHSGGYWFAFTSRHRQSDGVGPWVHHVSGSIVNAPVGEPVVTMPSVPTHDDGDSVLLLHHAGPMELGSRSYCHGDVHVASDWASAKIELPAKYVDDLSRLILHPSLLDMATGFVNMYLSPMFRMPLAYSRIRVDGPLPGTFTSHVRTRAIAGASEEVAAYDVVLVDADGRTVVVVEDLTMKRPENLGARLAALGSGTPADVPIYRPVEDGGETPAALLGTLANKITPEEGVAVFKRILHRDVAPQVVVTPRPIEIVAAELVTGRSQLKARGSISATTHKGVTEPSRPLLMTEYVPPRSDLERELVNQWQALLGVAQVGVHDIFSELGGHSLLGVRLATLIRETLEVDIQLSALLAAPTVAELAEVVAGLRRT